MARNDVRVAEGDWPHGAEEFAPLPLSASWGRKIPRDDRCRPYAVAG